ncbi:MAG: hypothetical protein AB7F09_26635 [Parvibaculaceae bacterium]
MSKKTKLKKESSQSQRQRFINAAKEADCSDDEKAFDEALKKIGRATPGKAGAGKDKKG